MTVSIDHACLVQGYSFTLSSLFTRLRSNYHITIKFWRSLYRVVLSISVFSLELIYMDIVTWHTEKIFFLCRMLYSVKQPKWHISTLLLLVHIAFRFPIQHSLIGCGVVITYFLWRTWRGLFDAPQAAFGPDVSKVRKNLGHICCLHFCVVKHIRWEVRNKSLMPVKRINLWHLTMVMIWWNPAVAYFSIPRVIVFCFTGNKGGEAEVLSRTKL